MDDKAELLEMTVGIVTSYLEGNPVEAGDLAKLIADVYASLDQLGAPPPPEPLPPLEPAVPVKKSITPDYLICLEDGRRFKSLKRHLRTRYGMTPDEYRAKWGLPKDYPMVAPNYAQSRSELAKTMGLGQARRNALAAASGS